MGSRGMLHVLPEQTIFVPGLRVPVKDTVGAGMPSSPPWLLPKSAA